MSTKATETTTARLIEVFSAIQGEGLNVGYRQIFIRFALCDLRCRFCDSTHTWSVPSTCRVERSAGERNFETHPNPVEIAVLLNWIERQNLPGLHDSITLTGGEPLLHAPFLLHFLPQVRSLTNLPIYLETGGHRLQQLELILPYLDSIGMDLKLPSVSGESLWQEHTAFLQSCAQAGVEVFVKAIVSDLTSLDELKHAAELVASINPEIPVFLQPVTPIESSPVIAAPSEAQVLTWQALMKQKLKYVRVVPQTHKMINQL